MSDKKQPTPFDCLIRNAVDKPTERRIEMADLDAIRQAIEERDSAIEDCRLMADETVYMGNSVSWWVSKAQANGTALSRAWDALRAAGINPDGGVDVADAIRLLAERAD